MAFRKDMACRQGSTYGAHDGRRAAMQSAAVESMNGSCMGIAIVYDREMQLCPHTNADCILDCSDLTSFVSKAEREQRRLRVRARARLQNAIPVGKAPRFPLAAPTNRLIFTLAIRLPTHRSVLTPRPVKVSAPREQTTYDEQNTDIATDGCP